MKPEWQRWLKEAVDRNREGMASSQIFVQLWDEQMAREPIAILQVGLAVLLDKPIYLVVPPGTRARLPRNLQALARDVLEIEVGDKESSAVVAQWLKEKAELE